MFELSIILSVLGLLGLCVFVSNKQYYEFCENNSVFDFTDKYAVNTQRNIFANAMYHIWLIIPIMNLILVSFILLAILCIILMGLVRALNTEESTFDYLMLVMVASIALVVAPVIELSVLLIPIYNNIIKEINKDRDESSDYEDYV